MSPRGRRPFRIRLVPSSVGEEEDWRDWFKGTYAMVWYLVGVMAACLFSLIELKDREDWPYSGIVAVIVVCVLGALGLRLLWPSTSELDVEE